MPSNLVSREEVGNVSELVVNHKGQHTHLGSTSLVQFDGTLGKLGFLIEGVPAEVNEAVAEVTNEFSASDVLHDGKLQESNEKKDLKGTGHRDSEGGIPSVSKVRELGSGVVNVSGKVDSSGVDQVSNNTKHADTAVLDLNISKTVELLLVTISNKAKGVEESKRRLGTKFILEGLQGGGGGGLLGRGESSGSGKKGGKDGGLHGFFRCCLMAIKKNCEQNNSGILDWD